MSAYLLGSSRVYYRVLHGSDTDVTWVTYVKMHDDAFVETSYFTELADDEKFEEKHVSHRVLTRKMMDDLFASQYGSPMHFINEEDYLKFINQSWK